MVGALAVVGASTFADVARPLTAVTTVAVLHFATSVASAASFGTVVAIPRTCSACHAYHLRPFAGAKK